MTATNRASRSISCALCRSIGLIPLVCGNIKGLQDRYRNPTTQAGFAKQWGQTPHMVTSFADGTKISFEQAIVANATGMCVAQRGMIGYEHKGHVDDLVTSFDVEELKTRGGIVEYVVGSASQPGRVRFRRASDERQSIYLDYGKLGKGPLYSFYVPYHLTIFEVPLSAARVALFGCGHRPDHGTEGGCRHHRQDRSQGRRCARRTRRLSHLRPVRECRSHPPGGALPIGLAEGCRLRRAVARDAVLRYADVELPGGRAVERLRMEQDEVFFGMTSGAAAGMNPVPGLPLAAPKANPHDR